MRLYGLIGYPLSHSFSQKYFTGKFEKEGIKDCRYENFPIANIEEVEKIFDQHIYLEGLNITIPYKEKIIAFLDETSEEVNVIGACNCIKVEKGRLLGFNTDVAGFEKSFVKKLKGFHKQAIVLGTGGASKAIQYALNNLNIPFVVVSRKPGTNELSYEDINEAIINTHQVIINTTPLGMQPNIHQCPSIPYLSLTTQHYLFDLTYNPAKTLFLQKGEDKGATIENGYEMLVNQAEGSWKIWNE